MKPLVDVTKEDVKEMDRPEVREHLREHLMDSDFEFDSPGSTLDIRRLMRRKGFGSKDRIFSPSFKGDDPTDDEYKSGMYQIWFRRWDVEGERFCDELVYGASCEEGLEDREYLCYRTAKAALWALAGYASVKEKFDPDASAKERRDMRIEHTGVL